MTYVLFALMNGGQPIKNQALAVPMAFKATRFAMNTHMSLEVGPFVRYLCHTYREHEQDIGSIYSLMDYAGITADYGKTQYQICKAFNEQLSAPQWVNLIIAVSNDDTIAGPSDMVRWFALKNKALDMCLPGAFGYWEQDEASIHRGDDGIVDTGGLSWLFSNEPIQPSASYRYWVPASYEFGTLDAELFAGISCLTHIPWVNLGAVCDGQSIAGESAQRLLFYGLYPDGSCDARIYDRASDPDNPVYPNTDAYDGVLYSALPVMAGTSGIWRFNRSRLLTLNQM